MKNVTLEISEDLILTLRIDLKKSFDLTRAGRSVVVASTQGNQPLWYNGQPLPNRIRLNLNVFRSLTEEEYEELLKPHPNPNVFRSVRK